MAARAAAAPLAEPKRRMWRRWLGHHAVKTAAARLDKRARLMARAHRARVLDCRATPRHAWQNLNSMRLLRLFRLLRSFKAISKVPAVRKLLRGLRAGLPDTGSYLLLLALYLYIVTLAGMSLFGGVLPAGGSLPSRAVVRASRASPRVDQ